MGDYVLVCRPHDEGAMLERSAVLAAKARQQGYAVQDLNPHAWFGALGPNPPKRMQVGGWTLIGDVINRRSPHIPSCSDSDQWNYERKLVARFWGRFVGVLFGSKDQPTAFLRDPSGAMECVVWQDRGLTIACSSAEAWLLPPVGVWRIDHDRVSDALHDLIAPTGPLMLDGPIALQPGSIQPLPLPQRAELIWRPRDFAQISLGAAPRTQEAMARLEGAIDEAVTGLADLGGPLAAEVSGGLDSALVAATLTRRRPGATALWINTFGQTTESDERRYVRALARTLDFEPHCQPHVAKPMTADWIDAISGGFRPGLNGMDYPQDLAWAKQIEAHGASAVMSGKGGDSILLQAATTDIFIDLWRQRRWRAFASEDVLELAAANEASIWTLWREALRYRGGLTQPLRRAHPILTPRENDAGLHPWLEGLEAFGPSKCFQIAGVADSVSHHGPSALTRAVDVRHPLCAQPVIETCLALPAWVLTVGGRDRGLARRVFADRLPTEILERRSKGEMTRVYGQMIVENLAFIRSWLMDGRLAALGLIDREAADGELTPEVLIWRGQYATLFTMVTIEGWVRSWEGRLGQTA